MRIRSTLLAVLIASALGCSRDADSPPPARADVEAGAAAETKPAPAAEPAPEATAAKVDGSRFVENPTEVDVIASSPNYNAEVVAAVDELLAKTKPDVKAEMLLELRAGKKIAAIKRLRAAKGCGLRDAKLAAELLAVRNGVDPGVLRRPAAP